jgi:centrosomal protein CEP104
VEATKPSRAHYTHTYRRTTLPLTPPPFHTHTYTHRYKVVSFSSEDGDYPAAQLNTVSPSTRGWQSVRFCPYPQELGFEMLDGYVIISQIQLLSHQSKISNKVEIFIGEGSSYRTATFKRLGYLSLDSNERSNFQARELKTVFIDHAGKYIKLLINENHVNKQNIYNQGMYVSQ